MRLNDKLSLDIAFEIKLCINGKKSYYQSIDS